MVEVSGHKGFRREYHYHSAQTSVFQHSEGLGAAPLSMGTGLWILQGPIQPLGLSSHRLLRTPTFCKWSWATQEALIMIKQDSATNRHHTGECLKATEMPPPQSQATTVICHLYCWEITLR